MLQQDKDTAFTIEYLICEAMKQESIYNFYIRNDVDRNIFITFPIPENSINNIKLPTPPAKFRPQEWGNAVQVENIDKDNVCWITWTWKSECSLIAFEYAAEITRFIPANILFKSINVKSGHTDPLLSESTDIARRIDDDTILVLVSYDEPPKYDYYSKKNKTRIARPNIVYDDGISRFNDKLGFAGRSHQLGIIEENKHRTEAKTVFLEGRIVTSRKVLKNNINNPDLDYFPSELIERCVKMCGEMYNEWEDIMHLEGYSILNSSNKNPHTISRNIICEPYKNTVTGLTTDPIVFVNSDMPHAIRLIINHALVEQTQYTPVDSSVVNANRAVLLSISADIEHMSDLITVNFNQYNFTIDLDDDIQYENNLILRAQSIKAYISILDLKKEPKQIILDLPMVLARSNKSSKVIVLTTNYDGCHRLTKQEIRFMLENSNYYHSNIHDVAINTIFHGKDYAFAKEIESILNKYTMISQKPNESMNFILNPDMSVLLY